MFFICFVSRNGNKKKTRRRIKHKKRRMGALRHYSIACKLYTQIWDCLMPKTFRATPLLITSRQLLLYFFMCCAKPVMQKSNIFAYGSVLFICFCKSYTKTFCIFHRKTPISLRQFLNKKRLQHSRFSTNFVKCFKEHLWVTVSLILYITV